MIFINTRFHLLDIRLIIGLLSICSSLTTTLSLIDTFSRKHIILVFSDHLIGELQWLQVKFKRSLSLVRDVTNLHEFINDPALYHDSVNFPQIEKMFVFRTFNWNFTEAKTRSWYMIRDFIIYRKSKTITRTRIYILYHAFNLRIMIFPSLEVKGLR